MSTEPVRITRLEVTSRRLLSHGCTVFNFAAERSDLPGRELGWQWRMSDMEWEFCDFFRAWGWEGLCWLLGYCHHELMAYDPDGPPGGCPGRPPPAPPAPRGCR